MLTILARLIQMGAGWLEGRQQLQKAKLEHRVAETQQKSKLISDTMSNNHSWELAALAADRLTILRQFSFWLFTAPIIYTVFSPEHAQRVWNALDAVPDWVIGVQLTMTGFIWASRPLSNLGAMLTSKRPSPPLKQKS